MVAYDYRCKKCSEDFEYVCSIENRPGDEGILECPACKSEDVRRVYSPPGISFKGSGFYRNDSRKNQ